jgi:uncharacterized protein YcfL
LTGAWHPAKIATVAPFKGKVLQMKAWVVVTLAAAFLVGCTSNETEDKEKRGSTKEETRFVTQLVTVEQTVEETTVVTEEPNSLGTVA